MEFVFANSIVYFRFKNPSIILKGMRKKNKTDLLPIITLSDFDSQTEKGNVMDPDSLNESGSGTGFNISGEPGYESGFRILMIKN